MKLSDLNLCIVDIETTGASHQGHRIIDVAALKVKKGKLIKTFHSLVNPQRPIPPYVSQLTGITDEAVLKAPLFADVHRELLECLGDDIFVAHNARFDYGFIRQDLEYLGVPFNLKMLCSVRLSRELFKGLPKHDLSSIIERYQIQIANRHRALDDAMAVWKFFEVIEQTVDPKLQKTAIAKIIKAPVVPPLLKKTIDHLPHSMGVYIFYDKSETIIYVGKAKDMRLRILNHFALRSTPQERLLIQEISRIEVVQTQGELASLLLEAHLIKTHRPQFNRRFKQNEKTFALKAFQNINGYDGLTSESCAAIDKHQLKNIALTFRTKKNMTSFLEGIAQQYKLCRVLLGLQKDHPADVVCNVCQGKEPALKHNFRLQEALIKHKRLRWPFDGAIVIEEANYNKTRGEVFVIDQWIIEGAYQYEGEARMALFEPSSIFDAEVFKILNRYLQRKKNISIKPYQAEELGYNFDTDNHACHFREA